MKDVEVDKGLADGLGEKIEVEIGRLDNELVIFVGIFIFIQWV